jgi:hypothetical protein
MISGAPEEWAVSAPLVKDTYSVPGKTSFMHIPA